jgi:2-hydroxy-4-carboxymuconate semialdehyde hemiacetal dehydrogenase
MSTRICIVGNGAIANIHAQILIGMGAILYSVVGRSVEGAAGFASEFGIPVYTTDLAVVLSDSKVDAVVIASPNAVHAQQAAMALQAGKHVLVEIPLALSYQEATEIVALAKLQRRTLMVCHSQRFIPALRGVRDRIFNGQLHVYHVVGRHATSRRVSVGWTGRPRSWTDNVLWHHGAHLVDFSLWLLGVENADVLAQIARPYFRTNVPMDVDVLLKTSADTLVSLSLSHNSHVDLDDYLIVGEEESLQYDRGSFINSSGTREDSWVHGADHEDIAWQAQDREFLQSIQEERDPQSSGADVLPAYRILQGIEDRFANETSRIETGCHQSL